MITFWHLLLFLAFTFAEARLLHQRENFLNGNLAEKLSSDEEERNFEDFLAPRKTMIGSSEKRGKNLKDQTKRSQCLNANGNGVKPTQYPLQQQIIHNCDQPIYKVQNFTFFKENPNYKIADNQKMDHASYFMLKVLECPCRRNCKSTKDVIVRLCVDGAEVKFTFKECERC